MPAWLLPALDWTKWIATLAFRGLVYAGVWLWSRKKGKADNAEELLKDNMAVKRARDRLDSDPSFARKLRERFTRK